MKIIPHRSECRVSHSLIMSLWPLLSLTSRRQKISGWTMWGSGKRNYPFYRRLDKSGTPRKHLTNYNYLAFKHKPTAIIRWQYVIIVRWQSGIIVIVTNTSRSLTKTLTRTDKIIHFPRSDSHTNKWIVWHSPVFWSFYEHLRSVSGHVWSACQCHWLMSHPILSQNVCLAVIVRFVNRLIDGKQDTFNIALVTIDLRVF